MATVQLTARNNTSEYKDYLCHKEEAAGAIHDVGN